MNLAPPGQSGNPAGRKPGSRQKFSEALVGDFIADWHEHGPAVLARVRATEQATYLRVASVLVPRDVNVAVTADRNSLGIDPPLWRAFQRVLSALEECASPGMTPDAACVRSWIIGGQRAVQYIHCAQPVS
jgi:hypothetical protein